MIFQHIARPRTARRPAELIVALGLMLLACTLARADTNWPGYMGNLQPSASMSSVAAVLPANVSITPPAPELPANIARWSGTWTGWAGATQEIDTKLAVESINAEGGSIIYAYATSQGKPYTVRVPAKFVGDELHATLPSGATLYYRMRPTNVVEFRVENKSQLLAAGVLGKAK